MDFRPRAIVLINGELRENQIPKRSDSNMSVSSKGSSKVDRG